MPAARETIEHHVRAMPGSLDEWLRAGIHLLMVLPDFRLGALAEDLIPRKECDS